MTIYYNAQDRKPLVKAISEFTGADAVYMRTPTYAYRIDYFTVTREGNLEFDDRADSEEIEGLIEFLAERGFIAEVADTEPLETDTEEVPAAANSAEHSKPVGLTVEVPLDGSAVENLTKLLKAKGRLIRCLLYTSYLRSTLPNLKRLTCRRALCLTARICRSQAIISRLGRRTEFRSALTIFTEKPGCGLNSVIARTL